MQLWCVLAEKRSAPAPGCVHLRHMSAVNLDTKTIAGTMKAAYSRRQNQLVPALYARFRWAFVDFAFDFSRGCWPLHRRRADRGDARELRGRGGAAG